MARGAFLACIGLILAGCGTAASGADVGGIEEVRVVAAISIERTAQVATGAGMAAGVPLEHRYTVTNTGSVALRAVDVDDPAVGRIECPLLELSPDPDRIPPYNGESMVCESSTRLSQTDVDRGQLDLMGTVVALTPQGDRVEAADEATVQFDAEAKLDVTMDLTPEEHEPGDEVAVRVLAQNKGAVTLTGVDIQLPGAIGGLDCSPPGLPSVPPQGVVVCVASVIAPVAAIDATSDQTDGSYDLSTQRDAVLGVDRTATLDQPTAELTTVGAAVTYDYTVTNQGARALADLAVSDDRAPAVTCASDALAAGESTTCRSQIAVTQEEINSGFVASTAVVTAVDPTSGRSATVEGIHTLPLESVGKLEFVLAADRSKVPFGETVTVTATVSNPGNASIAEATVVFFSQDACGRSISGLDAGASESWTCEIADVQSDQVITAQADAPLAGGEWATIADELTIDSIPRLNVEVKPADSDLQTGGYVGYSVLVINEGGGDDPISISTMTDSRYGDLFDRGNPLVASSDCKPNPELAAGYSYDCWFQVTLDGVPSGTKLANEVTVTAADDEGNQVQGSAVTTVLVG